MKAESIRSGSLRILVFLCVLTVSFPVAAQQLIGTYNTNTPEASLFFLSPGYMNPALGNGVLGMHANPAALKRVSGSQFALAFEFAQSSQTDFTIQAVDKTEVYDALSLEAKVEIKEPSGLAAFGYAQQFGRWRMGVAITRARRGGFALRAQGSIDVDAHFQVDQPITKDMVSNLPVDEIPVVWDVNSTITVDLSSEPAELYLSVLPIMAGLSYSAGPLSLGLGLQYFDISSSNKRARLTSSVTGTGTITGSPTGTDPFTGQNWAGSVTADFSIDDQPLIADYAIDVSGNRVALSLGGMLNLGPISLGATYTHGFPGKLSGSYDISTVRTIGLPEEIEIPQIELDLTNSPNISGHASIQLADFVKDTVSFHDMGDLTLGSYEEYSVGLHFLVFGVFAGINFPRELPDLRSIYGGVYVDFSLPFAPVRFNAGLIHRSDAIEGEKDEFIPYRVVTHVGAGLAVELPLNRWIGLGFEPYWLRFGLRSSLASFTLDAFENEFKDTVDKDLPPLFDNIALSCGLEIPL